jgi:hypothetical protein
MPISFRPPAPEQESGEKDIGFFSAADFAPGCKPIPRQNQNVQGFEASVRRGKIVVGSMTFILQPDKCRCDEA